ncbi:MAG TPA: hypothetical protein VE944_29195 [Nostoc sp.]|uniref:hypothetical protein n=1 Tax=Nostoc sp. TaxID=1180 RepID=UPI002D6D2228|nr:hypothetical protein [Nostoc sp.]HYX18370.1 hypothetical protein [Nostoc sp.]
MTDDSSIDKKYVERYFKQAQNTDSEDLKNNALYRVGTQMEILPCDGNANLSSEQQQNVIDAAKKLLDVANCKHKRFKPQTRQF